MDAIGVLDVWMHTIRFYPCLRVARIHAHSQPVYFWTWCLRPCKCNSSSTFWPVKKYLTHLRRSVPEKHVHWTCVDVNSTRYKTPSNWIGDSKWMVMMDTQQNTPSIKQGPLMAVLGQHRLRTLFNSWVSPFIWHSVMVVIKKTKVPGKSLSLTCFFIHFTQFYTWTIHSVVAILCLCTWTDASRQVFQNAPRRLMSSIQLVAHRIFWPTDSSRRQLTIELKYSRAVHNNNSNTLELQSTKKKWGLLQPLPQNDSHRCLASSLLFCRGKTRPLRWSVCGVLFLCGCEIQLCEGNAVNHFQSAKGQSSISIAPTDSQSSTTPISHCCLLFIHNLQLYLSSTYSNRGGLSNSPRDQCFCFQNKIK